MGSIEFVILNNKKTKTTELKTYIFVSVCLQTDIFDILLPNICFNQTDTYNDVLEKTN